MGVDQGFISRFGVMRASRRSAIACEGGNALKPLSFNPVHSIWSPFPWRRTNTFT